MAVMCLGHLTNCLKLLCNVMLPCSIQAEVSAESRPPCVARFLWWTRRRHWCRKCCRWRRGL